MRFAACKRRPASFVSPILLVVAVLSGLTMRGQTVVQFPGTVAVAGAPMGATVTVTVAQTGTVGSVSALTEGAANLDFLLVGGGSCAAGNSYSAGQTCTAAMSFAPRYPGQRHGAVALVASDGTVLGTTYLEGTATGSLSVLMPGQMTTVAGDTNWIYSGDSMAATSSAIFLPMGEVTDGAGNLYISDTNNNRVRRVSAATGIITTVAGGGTQGYSGDGGAGVSALLNTPTALAMDGAGNLYIADSGNYAVRVLSTISGVIRTVAGGQPGSGGDGGAATSAGLSAVNGLALDSQRGLYLADTGNNVIRRVDLGSGTISRVAGTGAAGYSGDGGAAGSAAMNTPQGIAFGGDGSLYIADLKNDVVRSIDTSGVMHTVAGGGTGGLGDGGPALQAGLTLPAAVAIDQAGNLYIADAGSNRIRKVSGLSGVITTIAGNGNEAFAGDGGPADEAQLYGPYSIFFDGQGNLFVGDMFHNRIRRINGSLSALKFDPIRVDRTSPAQLERLENDGNAVLNAGSPALVNASLDPATTTCVLPSTTPMAVGSSCVLGVAFSPTVLGDDVMGSVTLNSDAGDSPAVVTLEGQVLSVDPTATTLTSSANPSGLGAAVTFTAHVTTEGSGLTGTVQFFDGGTSLGSATLNGSHSASVSASGLTLGQHSITVVYSGDATNAASSSAVLVQSVKQATAVTLVSNNNPSLAGEMVTLTATVAASGSTPTGALTFISDGVVLGTLQLNAGGEATWTVATLAIGSHTLTASYAGDGLNSGSGSPGVAQVVKGQASSLALTTSNAVTPVGTAVTFFVQAGGSTPATPTGVVTFQDGGNSIGTAVLDGSGAAKLTTTGLTPGSHTVTAVYAGDASYAGSTAAALLETVQQLATGTMVMTNANPTPAGAAVMLTAVVTAVVTAPSMMGGVLAGSVSFMNGGTVLGTGTLTAGGLATLSVATLPLGANTISASYAGSTNYLASTSAGIALQVVQASSTTVLGTSLTPSIAEDGITLTATVTTNGGRAAGVVTFLDGGVAIGGATLSDAGVATVANSTLAVGRHTLMASYAGEAKTLASVSAVLAQTVLLRPTANVLTSSATSLNGGQQVTLISVVQWTGALTPTGTVTFQSNGVVLGAGAIDAAGVAALTINPQAGTTTVMATYSGDATYAGSTSAANTIPLGTPPLFTVRASQTALTMKLLQHETVDVMVASEKGFSDDLLFGCAGLPVAATCTFSQDWLALAADGGGTVHVVVDTGSPLTAGSVAKNDVPRTGSRMALCGLPFGALCGLLLWRGRRLRRFGATVLLLGTMGLAGCGSITTRGTPAGVYHFQITAAARGAGVIQSVNMTLAVTQ